MYSITHIVFDLKISNTTISGLLFADDFVGLAETGSGMHTLINNVHNYSKHWRFEANIRKCVAVIFQNQGNFLASGLGVMKTSRIWLLTTTLG